MVVLIIGLAIGVLVGLNLPFVVPTFYATYLAVAVLSGLSTLLGGLKAGLDDKFDVTIFTTGFVLNTAFALFLTYLGLILGVELYYVALFAFGYRMFDNVGDIRRLLLNKSTDD